MYLQKGREKQNFHSFFIEKENEKKLQFFKKIN
jgi:hypothetical protein